MQLGIELSLSQISMPKIKRNFAQIYMKSDDKTFENSIFFLYYPTFHNIKLMISAADKQTLDFCISLNRKRKYSPLIKAQNKLTFYYLGSALPSRRIKNQYEKGRIDLEWQKEENNCWQNSGSQTIFVKSYRILQIQLLDCHFSEDAQVKIRYKVKNNQLEHKN